MVVIQLKRRRKEMFYDGYMYILGKNWVSPVLDLNDCVYSAIPCGTIPLICHAMQYHAPHHTLLYRTTPCHAISYHIIPCHTIHTISYHTIHAISHHTIPSMSSMPYHIIPYHIIPYHTQPYHTIQNDTIHYNSTQYSTLSHHTTP